MTPYVMTGILFLLTAMASAVEPVRDTAACGSPLAKYDPNRELGLGEAVPEEPDQPLRRYLYLNMQDSSEDTFSRGGIVVLDLDNNLKFVKRIGSPTMTKGGSSANSLNGVRWQHGSAITDRLYYGYWQPGAQFMKGINPASPIPGKANGVVGCLDLRTDQTTWEQPGFNIGGGLCVFPDGAKVLAMPSWPSAGYGKLTVLDALTGKFLQTIDALGTHGACIGAGGKYIYKEDWKGLFAVVETSTLEVIPIEKAFPGLLELVGWENLPSAMKVLRSGNYNDVLRANGREDVLWSQVRAFRLPGLESGGQMTFDLANNRVGFSPVNAAMISNAIDPDCSQMRKVCMFHYVYDNTELRESNGYAWN